MSLDANVERVAEVLTGATVRAQQVNVGTVTGFLRRESAEHLAQALLAPGGVVAEIETDALGRGYIEGWRKGAAEVRARVEAVDFKSRRLGSAMVDPWTEGWNRALEVCQDDLRAALDAQNATQEPRTHHDAATDTTDDPTRRQEASE